MAKNTKPQLFSGKGSQTANNTYSYEVSACNYIASNCGGYSASASVLVTLPPTAPSSISLPSQSNWDSSFTVSYGTATGVSPTYHVDIGTYSSGQYQWTAGHCTSTATSCNFTAGQVALGTYYARVYACNQSACGSATQASNTITVWKLTPPGAPSLSAPSTVTSDSIPLSWTAPSTTTSYNLYKSYEKSGSFGAYTEVSGLTGTSYTDTFGALVQAAHYYVVACNQAGCGPDSNVTLTTVQLQGTCKTCSPTNSPSSTTAPPAGSASPPSGTGLDAADTSQSAIPISISPLVALAPMTVANAAMRVNMSVPTALPVTIAASAVPQIALVAVSVPSLPVGATVPVAMAATPILREQNIIPTAIPVLPTLGTPYLATGSSLAALAPAGASRLTPNASPSSSWHYGPTVSEYYAGLHTEPASSTTTQVGLTVLYAYTSSGYLEQLSNAVYPSQVFWTANSEDAFGQIASESYGGGVISSTIAHADSMGRITGISSASGSTILQGWTYQWDTLGNLVSRADNSSGGNASEQFQYDILNRLTQAQVTNGSGVQPAIAYSYDALGDITSKSDTGAYTYGGGAGPHAVTSISGPASVTYPASVAPGAPVASAVATPTGTVAGGNITLNGSGSTDPNGLALSYQWSGPSGVSIASPTAETTTVTSMTPGAYTIQLVVSDQNASSTPATVNVTFSPPAPGAPTTSPNPSTNGGYTVNWNGVTGASSYELYESTDGTSYTYLATVSGTSDPLTGRANGSYYYKVSACENSVCGPLSAASSAESVLLPPPVPTGLAVTPNPSTTGSFTLSWNSAATATSYKVYQTGNGTPLGTVTGTSYGTSAGDGTYSYYVTACNTSGCSSDSTSVSETVTLPPGTPSTPSASPNPSTNGSFTVTWSAPGGAWTSMQFEESPDQSTWTTETTGGTSWPGSGFGNGTYYFRTIYCDGSACSTSGTGSVLVTLPPGVPGSVSLSPNPSSNGSYTLSWSVPSGTVTAYDVYSGGGTFITSTTGTSASFSGIADGSYGYYVTACNQTACSGASSTVTETVLHVPGVPPSVSLSPSTTYVLDAYTLSWGAASGTVSYYMINGSTSLETSSLSYTFGGKPYAGSYTYYVQACNSSGCGGNSATVTETILSGGGGCKTCSPTTSPQTTPTSIPSSPTPAPSASSGGGLASAMPQSLYPSDGSPGPVTVTALAVLPQSAVTLAWQANSVPLFGKGECGVECMGQSSVFPCHPPFGKGGRGGISGESCTPSRGTVPGVLSMLMRERQSLTAHVLRQPSEAALQANSVPPFGKGGCGGISDAPCAGAKGITSGVLLALGRERQQLAAKIPAQPSESLMQAEANAQERATLPSLLPPAPEKDLAAWNTWDRQWKQAHPNGPQFAPPEYIAWAGAKLEPASGSTYHFEVQYSYDSASGALVSVSNAQTGFIYWQPASGGAAPVDAFGHLLAWTDGNNVSTVMAYDQATGAPVGISSGIGQSSAVQSLAYTWDGFGNLEERQNANQSNLYETLTYDDLNRLSTSTVTNSAGNGPGSSFNYDAAGNITTRTIAGTSETYNYDPGHPYAVDSVTDSSGTIYSASYDADGDMTTRNGYSIQWTVDNLPESLASSTGSSTFSYGPDGNRYSQTATFNGVTTDTTYVGSLFEVVSTATDTEYRHNIIADGQIVAVHTIDQSGSAYTDYLHADHLGSVDAITDDSGNVIQAMSFDAFGLRRDPSNWDYDLSQNQIATLKNYTDRGYTDQEQLDNLSLVDLNGRVYDPTVGRMISADPTVPAPFYSQAFNRYSYVYNSPFEYVDPSGYTGNPLQFSDCDLTGCFTATIVATSGPAFTYSNNVITESQTQQQNNIVALGAAPNPTVTVSPTAIGAPGATGTAATPVGTGGTSPIQPPWLAPINPPGPCQCNVGGDNQVGSEMDSTDGATTWDGTCFGCGGSVNPTVTDTRLNPDGPGNTGGDPSARTPISPQGLPPRPGVGPMHPGTTILGTMGATLDFGLGAVQYSRLGGYWLGKNWNIYNPAWGGNQYAGSRSLAPTLGEWAEVGSKALYGGEYIYGTFEYFNDLQTGNYNGALTVATNLALGGIFLELGPPGWIAGGIYFGIEYTIGWQSIFNANSNFYLQQQQTLGPGWNPYGGP